MHLKELITISESIGKRQRNLVNLSALSSAIDEESQDSLTTSSKSDTDKLLDTVMKTRHEDGLNILERCCYILFENKDERFLLFVLEEVPNVQRYIYIRNSEGWLPIFRLLHLFNVQLYENEKTKRTKEIAQKVLTALLKLDYDFFVPSGVAMHDLESLSTFEMILF